MIGIECSVWNNGRNGWGLKVLGGTHVRLMHFRRDQSPILVELDGASFPLNVDKKSFWTKDCGELIGVALRSWIVRHGLTTGDRVWLEVVERHHRFKAVRVRVTFSTKEVA